MVGIFLDWFQNTLNVSDDVLFLFSAVASLFILSFLLDFLRFLMYYITRR